MDLLGDERIELLQWCGYSPTGRRGPWLRVLPLVFFDPGLYPFLPKISRDVLLISKDNIMLTRFRVRTSFWNLL
jgi:hypothetical protein